MSVRRAVKSAVAVERRHRRCSSASATARRGKSRRRVGDALFIVTPLTRSAAESAWGVADVHADALRRCATTGGNLRISKVWHNFTNKKIMSYTNLLYHIIFRTKASDRSIPFAKANMLYNYIWGIVRNKNSKLYRIGGMPDHIHMLVELPSSISVSEFVRVVKVESSKFLSDNYEDFPLFKGWAKEYCALTYSFRDRDVICNYIRNQQQHHLGESLYNELQRLLAENAIEYKSEYLFND